MLRSMSIHSVASRKVIPSNWPINGLHVGDNPTPPGPRFSHVLNHPVIPCPVSLCVATEVNNSFRVLSGYVIRFVAMLLLGLFDPYPVGKYGFCWRWPICCTWISRVHTCSARPKGKARRRPAMYRQRWVSLCECLLWSWLLCSITMLLCRSIAVPIHVHVVVFFVKSEVAQCVESFMDVTE